MDDITLMDKAPYAELVTTPWGRWFISDMADFMGAKLMKAGTNQVYGGKIADVEYEYYRHSDTIHVEGNFGVNYHPVEISVCRYTDKQIQDIEAFFKENAQALAELKELRLPLETIMALERLGVPMRLTREDDTVCDYYCRDGGEGEPCSHVAGLVVRMGHMVDNDPCWMFMWHGYNIRSKLGIRNAPPEKMPDPPKPKAVRHRDINPADYATTWWGQAFVAPFACNDNRDALRRAKSDITSGRMGKLTIGTRSGKVSGTDGKSRGTKGRVVMEFEQMSAPQKDELSAIFRKHPEYAGDFSVGTLPEGLSELMEKKRIPLWFDYGKDAISCSNYGCQWDGASDRCQHCLALALTFTKSVDADPALLFRLRGFNIDKAIKGLGVLTRDIRAGVWMPYQKLMDRGHELDSSEEQAKTASDLLDHLNRVTYAKLPKGLLDSMLALMPATVQGLSSKQGAREVLREVLACAKAAASEITSSSTRAKVLPDFPHGAVQFDADGGQGFFDDLSTTLEIVDGEGESSLLPDYYFDRIFDSLHEAMDSFDSPGSLMKALASKRRASIPVKARVFNYGSYAPHSFNEMHSGFAGLFNFKIDADVIASMPPQTYCAYLMLLLACKMISAGAVMPFPLECGKSPYVRWLPNLLSREVETLTAKAGSISRRLMAGTAVRFGKGADGMSDLCFGASLLGIFIDDLVCKGFKIWCDDKYDFGKIMARTPEFVALFMGSCPGEKAIADRLRKSVGDFIAPLYIAGSSMLPVLILENPYSDERSAMQAEEQIMKAGREDPASLLDPSFKLPDPEEAKAQAKGSRKKAGGRKARALAPDAATVYEDPHAAAIRAGFIDRESGRYIGASEIDSLTAAKASECRRGLLRIASLIPDLKGLASGAEDSAELSLAGLQNALLNTLPALALTGTRVILPRSMADLLRPSVSASIKSRRTKAPKGLGLVSLADLLTFDWKATLGGEEIPDSEFEKLAEHAGHLVRFGEEYVYISAADAQAIARLLHGKSAKPSKLRVLQAALSGSYGGEKVFIDEGVRKAIEEELKTPPAVVPEGINASLRPYQERGFSWLVHNLRARMGSIIADDMGLGKTLQVISALKAMKDQKLLSQALVVVPASIVLNWEREVRRFAPSLTTNVFYGSSRRLDEESDLTITTYGTVRSEAKALSKREWSVIVADEAQNIKNPQSQIFQAMSSLKRGAAIAMTGTPVENRLADYWAIMEFVNPGLFGTFSDFNSEYALPIERERDADAVQRLRQVTAPFIIRRLKSDKSVIADLPDKISTDRYCALTKSQAAMYQALVNDGLDGINESDPAIVRSANVLKLILRLKQACDAPELFAKDHGPSQGPAQSGKALALLDLLTDITAAGRKAIVFTQFKEMGDLLVKWIGLRLGSEPDFINGSVPVKRRQEMVDRFQTDPRDRIMVLSLKAAGTGLNLTAASAVIHYDLWWNPAVEDQATDRAYRIGQHSNVEVFRFICANTFEEKINDIINSKKELADLTVLKGEKWLGDMSKSELRQFLSLAGGIDGADGARIEDETEGEV